jgi:NAD(P)-dependent dehydrogenase (short-subunit alcohol dehydrogenase family)
MNVLLTGGSSGIGLQTALKLKEDGHDVTITYFSNSENATNLTHNYGINCIHLDLNSPESIKELSLKIESESFDTLINNACPPFPLKPLRKVEEQEFMNYLSNGVNVVHSLSKSFVKSRKKNGGRILNILSAYTLGTVQTQMAPYITLKYALLGLTRCMAKEYHSKNIVVNAVSPSMTDTRLLREVFPERFIEMAKESHPSGDILSPELVADSIIKLLRFDSSVVGVNLPITGSAE